MNDQDPKVKSPVLEDKNQNTEVRNCLQALRSEKLEQTSTEEKASKNRASSPLVRS